MNSQSTVPPPNVIQLRQLLAERFPQCRPISDPAPAPGGACVPTGLESFDRLLDGGLPRGAITELTGANISSGSALFLRQLLRQTHLCRSWAALIDGCDCFDPAGLDNETLSRLLWIRCARAVEALQAADLLLRDGNLPLVLLDLRLNSKAQLRKITPSNWYRLQRIIGPTSAALLVITSNPMVKSARARVALKNSFPLEALTAREEKLLAQLDFTLLLRRTNDRTLSTALAAAG